MSLDETLKKAASLRIKGTFQNLIKKIPEPDYFFADSMWSGGGNNWSSMWQIKLGENNLDKIEDNIQNKRNGMDPDHEGVKVVSGKSVLDWYFVGGPKTSPKKCVRFVASHKKSAKAADAKTTAMQERPSAWIMKRAIKDSYSYDKWTDIKKDPKYKELEKLYPGVEEEWLKVFFAQQKKMLDEFKNVKFNIFNRDEGFMDYISNKVKTKFGISKKDTWNPADIWCIKDQRGVEKLIDETVDGNGSQTILELNAVLRKLFNDRDVVGISLKKVSGDAAKYEEYNAREDALEDDYNWDILDEKIDLSLKGDTFSTQDSRIVVGGNGASYDFQIKANDSKGVSNLKWEPTEKGAKSARVGKAPRNMVEQLIKDAKKKLDMKHQDYPATRTKFQEEAKDYKALFTKLKSTHKIETYVANETTFEENMLKVYETEPHVAHSKCMQMKFLDVVYSLPEKKRREFMTDMVFLAAKKGKRFGPFGKLY